KKALSRHDARCRPSRNSSVFPRVFAVSPLFASFLMTSHPCGTPGFSPQLVTNGQVGIKVLVRPFVIIRTFSTNSEGLIEQWLSTHCLSSHTHTTHWSRTSRPKLWSCTTPR